MRKERRDTNNAGLRASDKLLRELALGNTPTRVMGLKLERTPEAVQSRATPARRQFEAVNQSPTTGEEVIVTVREKRRS